MSAANTLRAFASLTGTAPPAESVASSDCRDVVEAAGCSQRAIYQTFACITCRSRALWGVSATGTQMLDRLDFEPVFFAPFVSSVMRVEPAWIDHNGHLNMAYYGVLFDRAADEALGLIGYGPDYVKTRHHSCFAAELHIRYLRELHADDQVRVTFQLLAYDVKRIHFFEQLFHAGGGWVAATAENMALHVDLASRKTAPFPSDLAAGLGRMKAAHARLPVPEAAGRRIAMPAKR
jgi:acyl-CoA thioester hydrolase